ncbi:hypothetical protein [Muricoccus radiodurans]|uniref:hypothetical protein n=1 Tax=Muricoccus radiodurans TaxID=2231721 RepID=UPI003CF238A0
MNHMAPAQERRLRLAVISTYDDLCGIAGYTRALVPQLEPWMEVEVFDLDQFLLRSTHRRIQRLADRHIREIAARLGAFDAVNIQLEFGTLGLTPPQIVRRMRRLANASPALSVTFHTVLDSDGFPWPGILGAASSLRFGRAKDIFNAAVHKQRLALGMHRLLRATQARKPLGLILHGKREARLMRDLHRYRNVEYHPLSFMPPQQATAIRAQTGRADFPQLSHLPRDTVLVGTFGFVSEYKGFETAIQALRLLPENHHLLVFGGVHPQRIVRHQPIDPYLDHLMDEGRIGSSVLDVLQDKGASRLQIDSSAGALLGSPPDDLTRRIHFMGALPDAEFARAMAVCDVVAMPYHEVGQTSSGALALALDMGCRVIASRTRNFLQLGRAMPGQIEFFDIGNFSELAQRIMTPAPRVRDVGTMPFNTATNAAMYRRVHERMAEGPWAARHPGAREAVRPPLASSVREVAEVGEA